MLMAENAGFKPKELLHFLKTTELCTWPLAMICLLFVGAAVYAQSPAPDKDGWALFVDMSNYHADERLPNLPLQAEALRDFQGALEQVGGYQPAQFVAVGKKDLRGIKAALSDLHKKLNPNSHLILYFRGYVMQPTHRNEFYLLPENAILGNLRTYISVSKLGDWLVSIRRKLQADNMVLLLEGYVQPGGNPPQTDAFDNLEIPILWRVLPAPSDVPPPPLLEHLGRTLRDKDTDLDRDRSILSREIQDALADKMPSLGRTGDGLLLKLPSLLEIESDLPDADFYIDDKKSRRKEVRPGEHRIKVLKSGYRPHERAVKVSADRAEVIRETVSAAHLSPIDVHGVVSDAASGQPIPDARVGIVRFPGHQTVTDNEGHFRFENLAPLLMVGNEYELNAEAESRRGTESFVYTGTVDIRRDLALTQVPWTQLIREGLIRDDCIAVVSHLTGDGLSSPEIKSLDLERILACLDTVLATDPENQSYLVYAGTVADTLKQKEEAIAYWKAVERLAPEGSQEAQLAQQRLERLIPDRTPWVIGFALLAGVAAAVGAVIIRRRGLYREIPNPYEVGKPIATEGMFFGRGDLFEFIQSRLSGSTQALTIVLYGGRRTGKTSVLYRIFRGELGPAFVPVFIDLQGMPGVDTARFFGMISQKTREAVAAAKGTDGEGEAETTLDSIEEQFEQAGTDPFKNFNDFLREIAKQTQGQYLIFLIDEYEILQSKIEAGDLDGETFSYMRHLMQNRENLAFVFAGSREFERMENRQWALMFNAAIPKKVSFLGQKDAVRLITEPVKGFVNYTPAAIKKMMRITAGQPYFTQLVCQAVVEHLNEARQKKVTPEMAEAVSAEIIASNTPYHLAYIWSESSREEKCVLSAMASLIDTESATANPDKIFAALAEHSLDLPVTEIRKTLELLMERELVTQDPYHPNSYYFLMDLTRYWMQSEHSIWSLLNELSNA